MTVRRETTSARLTPAAVTARADSGGVAGAPVPGGGEPVSHCYDTMTGPDCIVCGEHEPSGHIHIRYDDGDDDGGDGPVLAIGEDDDEDWTPRLPYAIACSSHSILDLARESVYCEAAYCPEDDGE